MAIFNLSRMPWAIGLVAAVLVPALAKAHLVAPEVRESLTYLSLPFQPQPATACSNATEGAVFSMDGVDREKKPWTPHCPWTPRPIATIR